MNEIFEQVIVSLREWHKGKSPHIQSEGICSAINMQLRIYCRNEMLRFLNLKSQRSAHEIGDIIVSSLSQDWVHFSGNIIYPVPAPTSASRGTSLKLSARDAYNGYGVHCGALGPLWGDGEYAALRRDLCRHIADKLENKISDNRREQNTRLESELRRQAHDE